MLLLAMRARLTFMLPKSTPALALLAQQAKTPTAKRATLAAEAAALVNIRMRPTTVTARTVLKGNILEMVPTLALPALLAINVVPSILFLLLNAAQALTLKKVPARALTAKLANTLSLAVSISAMSAHPVCSLLRPSQPLALHVLLDRIQINLEHLNAQNVPLELPNPQKVETVASIAIPDITVAKRA